MYIQFNINFNVIFRFDDTNNKVKRQKNKNICIYFFMVCSIRLLCTCKLLSIIQFKTYFNTNRTVYFNNRQGKYVIFSSKIKVETVKWVIKIIK